MFGVIAAVPTPVDDQGEPVISPFLSHCSWVLKNGCDGINILGSTGEANSFGTSQRQLIMSSAAEKLDIQKLMVGTGTPSLSETIYLTKFASNHGYKVALVLPPFYYKPLKNNGLFLWYQTLHEKLENHNIKIYFYNFPQMTGFTIPIEVIEDLNRQWPERFSGIKDSSGDLDYCRRLSKNENFKVFPSSEVSILEAHKSNFSGCISATTNQTLFLSSEAWIKRSENINALILKIKKIREQISSESLIPSIKYLVSVQTKDKTWQNILPPLNAINKSRRLELDAIHNQLLSSE